MEFRSNHNSINKMKMEFLSKIQMVWAIELIQFRKSKQYYKLTPATTNILNLSKISNKILQHRI